MEARGARIYAEVAGYGATSDGYDMVAPSGEGGARAMRMALETLRGRRIDYLNPHATSTPVGDIREAEAIMDVFGKDAPLVSGTKSMTGHSLGAAGVQEAIYSLIMMDRGFIAPSINVENLDPEIAATGLPIVTETREAQLGAVMSNSFGFGGTNGSVIFTKPE
jgi:3-oxoacyl-[acyl-carrier-protein] synthase-1